MLYFVRLYLYMYCLYLFYHIHYYGWLDWRQKFYTRHFILLIFTIHVAWNSHCMSAGIYCVCAIQQVIWSLTATKPMEADALMPMPICRYSKVLVKYFIEILSSLRYSFLYIWELWCGKLYFRFILLRFIKLFAFCAFWIILIYIHL